MARTVDTSSTFENWRQNYNDLATDVGALGNLTTGDKTSIVSAVNFIMDQYFFFQDFDFDGQDGATSNTVFSGNDNAGNTLAYSAGKVLVYKNGLLLRSGTDYTATNGTSITLASSANNSDVIRISAFTGSYENVASEESTSGTGQFILSGGVLHNKNTGGIVLNGDSSITTTVDQANTIQLAGDTFAVGDLSIKSLSGTRNELRLLDSDNSHYVAIKSPATVSSNVTFTMPDADGSAGQFLKTDGSGNFSFDTVSSTAPDITITANNSTDETVFPVFVDGNSGTQGLESDTGFTYNPSSGILTATQFSGALSGNATTATTAGTVTTAAQTNITSLGVLTALQVDDININGSTISDAGALTISSDSTITMTTAGDFTVDSNDDIILDANGADIRFKDNGANIGVFSNSSSNFVITSGVQDADIIFKGDDNGSAITALTLDMSEAGAATFNNKIVATELDISGNVDIDGTLEADAITVNGTTLAETISDTVGAMVGSNTESGISVTYDDSDNTLDFTVGTLNQSTTGNAATATALATGRNFSISGDITASAVSFDGTGNVALSATIDDNSVDAAALNISGNGTAGQAVLSDGDGSFSYGSSGKTTEEIQDIVGGMVSSNTESGITVTYQDGDGTLDFSVGTLNQDTTGNAATATTLETARTINGVSFNGGSNITTLTAGTGVSVSGTAVSIGQAVATSSDVQFDSFGVGTAASGTTGEIRATNDITAFYSSDISLKENINPISNALDKLSQIGGYTFDWTDKFIKERGGEDDYFMRKKDTGIIAQEIEEILPEVVATRPNGTKAVKYDKLTPLLIQAIKELKTELDELKSSRI